MPSGPDIRRVAARIHRNVCEDCQQKPGDSWLWTGQRCRIGFVGSGHSEARNIASGSVFQTNTPTRSYTEHAQ